MMTNPHVGSSFDDYLEAEGILAEVNAMANKEVLAWQGQSGWELLSRYGAEQARLVARERGLDWDAMTEEEREAFVDDVVHED
ncbi:hypothetical protein [Trichothermofontia sp.]